MPVFRVPRPGVATCRGAMNDLAKVDAMAEEQHCIGPPRPRDLPAAGVLLSGAFLWPLISAPAFANPTTADEFTNRGGRDVSWEAKVVGGGYDVVKFVPCNFTPGNMTIHTIAGSEVSADLTGPGRDDEFVVTLGY